MNQELDTVVLRVDVPEHDLKAGDVGAIVLCHRGGSAYEVEFVTGEGRTLAVLTLGAGDVRSLGRGEILHARHIAA